MRTALISFLGIFALLSPATAKEAPLRTPAERFGNLEKAESPSFRRHVIPLVSRTGCNGRECHGAFSGQGGFSLSLFGYDFEKDHQEITQDADGGEAEVRVNPKEPEQSLFLTKPTVQVKHKGKERFQKDSWEYNLMLKWIKDGAKIDVAETGEFSHLEVTPTEMVFKKPGEYVQLKVLAHWKDGTVEDVTQLTRFRSNDDSVATVSDTGRVSSAGPGDTHIVAFYDNGVHPVPTMLPVSDRVGSKYPKIAASTKVDDLILTKLRKVGIVPSEICTDAEFLRRASLDVTGTLPTPAEVEAFLADKSPTKRAKKIDELLTRPGYAAWFTTLLCDFTGNNPQQLVDGGGLIRNLNGEQSRRWYDWIYKRVSENMPYDQLAAGIILATSRTSPDQTYEDLAKEMAAYYRTENQADFAERPTMPYFWARRNIAKPQEKALAFSHSFLGVRIECAECHKHPFDQWTKQDFEQFQVFFTTIASGANRVAKDEGITYASLTQEIRDKVMADNGDKPFDKKSNDQNRAMQQEAMRRIKAGELVPWNEVYVDLRRAPQPPRKDRKEVKGSARVITPKILGGEEVMLQQYSDPRQPLMDWMRSRDNPYFARAFVNRVWANYFGRGIVEPADDMNLANPPVNKELMDYLAEGFVDHGFDMKWLSREILNSDAYQRSWKPNDTNQLDEKNFSHMVLRRVPAEVALDAITMATSASSDLSRFAADIPNRSIGPGVSIQGRRGNTSYALATFGKPARVANCDCERTADPTLLQTLFTRNDPELLTRLETGKGSAWIDELRRLYGQSPGEVARVENDFKRTRASRQALREKVEKRMAAGELSKADIQKMKADLKAAEQKEEALAAKLDKMPKPADFKADDIIQEVFLRTVSRPPTAEEMAKAKEDIAAAKNPVDGVRDVLWAMLNTREFLVNH
ncbi:MAG: DUF1549 domain-containing protein [Verrucomicrobiota bacterium]